MYKESLLKSDYKNVLFFFINNCKSLTSRLYTLFTKKLKTLVIVLEIISVSGLCNQQYILYSRLLGLYGVVVNVLDFVIVVSEFELQL